MYAAGIVGLVIGLTALFAAVFMGGPEPAALKTEHIAQNYAIAQAGVQQAVLVAAGQAKNWAAGTPLLTGSTCVTPLTRATACDIVLGTGQSAEISAQLPPQWHVLTETSGTPPAPIVTTPRWQGRIQGGMLYVYGAMSHEEMAALREARGNAPNMAFCRGGSGGDACVPPLREQLADGTLQALPLPPEVTGAANTLYFAVHATRIVQ